MMSGSRNDASFKNKKKKLTDDFPKEPKDLIKVNGTDVVRVSRHWFANPNWYSAYMSPHPKKKGQWADPDAKKGIEDALDQIMARGVQEGWQDLYVDGRPHMNNEVIRLALTSRRNKLLSNPNDPKLLEKLSQPPFKAGQAHETFRKLQTMNFYEVTDEKASKPAQSKAQQQPPATTGAAPAAPAPAG